MKKAGGGECMRICVCMGVRVGRVEGGEIFSFFSRSMKCLL